MSNFRVSSPTGTTGPTGPTGPIGFDFYYREKGILDTPVVVDTTPVDLTPIYGMLTTTSSDSLVTYDSINQVYKTDPTTTNFYSFFVNIRVSGTFVSTNESKLNFSIRRPDGVTEITSVELIRLNDEAFVSKSVVIPTRVFPGGADPYQVDGFKIYVVKVAGPNFTFDTTNAQEIVFETT